MGTASRVSLFMRVDAVKTRIRRFIRIRIRITVDRLSITSARLPPLVIWMLTAVAKSFRSVLRAVSATRRMES